MDKKRKEEPVKNATKKKVKLPPPPATVFTISRGGSFVRTLELIQKFAPTIDISLTKEGFRVNALSSDHTCLVNWKLEPGFFETFDCPKNHHIGMNLENTLALLKGIKDETIAIRALTDGTKIQFAVTKDGAAKNYELNGHVIESELLNVDSFKPMITADMLATTWIDLLREAGKMKTDEVTIHLNPEVMTFNFANVAIGTAMVRLKHNEAPKQGEVMIWGEGEFMEKVSTKLLSFVKPPTGQFEIAIGRPADEPEGALLRFSFPVRNHEGFCEIYITPKIPDMD